jgi:hypothetical protein
MPNFYTAEFEVPASQDGGYFPLFLDARDDESIASRMYHPPFQTCPLFSSFPTRT